MKKEIAFVDKNESIIGSIIRDTFSFSLTLLVFYINYKYIGNNVILQLLAGLVLLCIGIKYANSLTKKFNNKEEAHKFIDEYFEEV